jgi:tellurite resistance protein
LEVLERSGQVPADRAAAARSAYQQLQRSALQAITDLAALQQRMSQLLVRVQQVQVQQEMVQHGSGEPLQMLDRLREDRELARQEVRVVVYVGGCTS